MERGDKWLNSLKIAIINNDLNKIKQYSKRDVPYFDSINEAKEALSLIKEAISILEKEKKIVAKKLNSLKQTQKYTQSYHNYSTNNWRV
jgi:archaellum component FlaC